MYLHICPNIKETSLTCVKEQNLAADSRYDYFWQNPEVILPKSELIVNTIGL
jgi:hypothetical protein